jgi:hypothetical protein
MNDTMTLFGPQSWPWLHHLGYSHQLGTVHPVIGRCVRQPEKRQAWIKAGPAEVSKVDAQARMLFNRADVSDVIAAALHPEPLTIAVVGAQCLMTSTTVKPSLLTHRILGQTRTSVEPVTLRLVRRNRPRSTVRPCRQSGNPVARGWLPVCDKDPRDCCVGVCQARGGAMSTTNGSPQPARRESGCSRPDRAHRPDEGVPVGAQFGLVGSPSIGRAGSDNLSADHASQAM